jgi:heavy metal translocating P-type ATPase
MIQKLFWFFKNYWQFSIAFDALLISLALQLFDQATIAHWILGIISILLTLPLIKGMWHDFRMGTYGIDILAATAIIVSVVMHEYWAGIIIVLMLTGGEALEDYAEHRAKTELDSLLKRAPQIAHVIKSRGKVVDVPVIDVKANDRIEIRAGEVVPVDATVFEGEANFDESSLTGESLPQFKQVNQTLLSGAVNLDGVVSAKAVHTAKDSQYQQIIELVKAASASQSPFVRLADRYSIPFTLIAFAIAFGAWAVSGDSLRFLEVLVVATPCPLILAAPIAIISGMSRAAKHGIIVRTGSALERLAAAKTIAFDKTGTLTEGRLKVKAVKSYNGFTDHDILSFAASAEQSSNHVIAEAIIDAAHDKNIKTKKAKNIKETSGGGIEATIGGKHVLLGRLLYLQNNAVEKIPVTLKNANQTAVFLALNGQLAGAITFTDTVRPESKSVIAALTELRVKHTLMITGDNSHTANAVADKLGIETVISEALPAEKLLAVEKLEHKPVAFVGDGINDAPVLAAADVGIALGARGSTAASESADMVIMLDDITRVTRAVEISKRTLSIARQSIVVGIALSVVLMGIFATGRFAPVYGALIQEVVDIVVIVNALRAHGTFKPIT